MLPTNRPIVPRVLGWGHAFELRMETTWCHTCLCYLVCLRYWWFPRSIAETDFQGLYFPRGTTWKVTPCLAIILNSLPQDLTLWGQGIKNINFSLFKELHFHSPSWHSLPNLMYLLKAVQGQPLESDYWWRPQLACDLSFSESPFACVVNTTKSRTVFYFSLHVLW